MYKHSTILVCVSLAFGLVLAVISLAMLWTELSRTRSELDSVRKKGEALIATNMVMAETRDRAKSDLASAVNEISTKTNDLHRIAQRNADENLAFEWQHDHLKSVAGFQQRNFSELDSLTRGSSLDISVYAAWELVRRNRNQTYRDWNADRFLGFVEARTRLSIPTSWQYAVLNGEFSDDRFETDLLKYEDKFADLSWTPELQLCHPVGTSVSMTPERIQISINGERCEFPRKNLDKFPFGGGIAFQSSEDTYFYSPYDTILPSPQRLSAVKIENGQQRQLWDQFVWVSGTNINGLLPGEGAHEKDWSNHVKLVANDFFIGYFRVWEHGVYLEVFRASDGVRVLSFDSNVHDFDE